MHSPTDKASHDCVGRLIERLDEAVSSESVRARCRAIKDVLSDATRGRLHLDAQFLETADDGYARRLLHRDPDGRYSIVVMVWDRGQRTPIHDHDGTWCVECVYDGTIKVTSAVSGEVLMELRGHEGAVNCVHASKDGTRLVSGGDDQTVRVWDVKTGKLVSTMMSSGKVLSVAYSPCGKWIASGGGDGDNAVRIWDAATGAAVGSPLRGHRYDPFPFIECLLL